MDYLNKRQNDVQYLKTVIAQKQIHIEQLQRQKSVFENNNKNLSLKVAQLQTQLSTQRTKFNKQLTNLSMALKDMQHATQQLKQQKHQLQFQLNVAKMKNSEQSKQNSKQINRIKQQYQSQKDSLNQKITKLQKNLGVLNNQYNIQQQINEDKQKIIQDANRNLRGFANEKQQRMIIIQNQQFSNEIQFQSRQITSLLQKNEKLYEQIKQHKMDVQLHKNIENDLVKRSSLAQNLIKQLNNRIKQLQYKLQAKEKEKVSSNTSIKDSKVTEKSQSQQQSRVHAGQNQQNRQLQQAMAKLKYENANLKNYNHFLETTQKNNNKKYESLGQIMAQYLQILLYKNKKQDDILNSTISINLSQLKNKSIKEWKVQQTQAILDLLITQIKPFLSKASLTIFPQIRNIKVSFMEQQNKQPTSLPNIIEEYEKNQDKEKKGSRFKDIPVDISTKILRSNLRQWGTKINYGNNIVRGRKQASKSIMVEPDKQV